MTKENVERLYRSYRDAQKNYEAPPNMKSGLKSTSKIRESSKQRADEMEKKYPFLSELSDEEKEEEEQEEEEEKEDGPQPTG